MKTTIRLEVHLYDRWNGSYETVYVLYVPSTEVVKGWWIFKRRFREFSEADFRKIRKVALVFAQSLGREFCIVQIEKDAHSFFDSFDQVIHNGIDWVYQPCSLTLEEE